MLFLILLVINVQNIISFECNQEYEYLAIDGTCKQCETCPPGYEPTPYHCGYGVKSPLYSCKPCDLGTFSTSTDYNLCRTCSPCERWNALLAIDCTPTSNSVCGVCHSGYYRPRKADGSSDVECHKCNKIYEPSCAGQSINWTLAVVILSVISGFMLVVAGIFGCRLRKIKKTEVTSKRKFTPEKFCKRNLVVSCNSSTPGTSCELLTSSSKKSLQLNDRPLIEFDTETYSNQSTAQFQQSGQYSQLPTAQFHSRQLESARTTKLSCFESVDKLRRDIGTFDTASLNTASTSLPLISV